MTHAAQRALAVPANYDGRVEVLRDEVVPATVGKLDNTEVAVGGMTAWSKDLLDTMKSHLPIVFGFVLAMAFILLLVTFRRARRSGERDAYRFGTFTTSKEPSGLGSPNLALTT